MAGPYNYLSPMQPIKEAFSLSELTQARQFNENQRVAMQKEELQKHMLSEYEAINKNDINQIQSFINKNPGMSRQGQDLIKNIEENEKRNMKYTGIKAMLASRSGNVPLAISTLEKASEGYKNSDRQGDEQKAQLFDSAIESIKYDPENATKNLNLLGGSVFGKDWWESMESQTKIASTEAETQVKIESAKKLKIENIQLAKSLKDMAGKDGFIIDPKEKFDAELKLTDNFKKHTKVFDDTDNAYRRIVNATDDQLGDLSLIIGYMKMLDPGSVVREGEAEMVRKTKDIPTAIWNWYETVVEKRRLLPEQREKIFKQSKSLWGTADLKAKGEKDRIERQAKKYGLSDIFTKETKMGNEKPEDGKIGSGDNKPTEAGSAFMLKYNLIK